MYPSITIYTIAWNEKEMLRQSHTFYTERFPLAKFILYDNGSDDGTVELAKSLGYGVIHFDTGGKMDDKTHMEIKNNCWKACNTEWAMVTDMDEFVDVTEGDLVDADFEIVRCKGYEMFGNTEFIRECRTGVVSEGYSKVALFRPHQFIEMNFGAGAHICNPVLAIGGRSNYNTTIKLYHFKWSNPKRAIERAHILAQKQSDHNKQMNWSFHYALADEIHRDYYWNGVLNSKIVRQ